MTKLSVNLNKIALLRNSRGRDYPNVVEYAKRFIDLGVDGITVHPRQDERHIKYQDVYDLATLLKQYPDIEFNIEGYPDERFVQLVEAVKPDQCTLVPDAADQLTSDHGWQIAASKTLLEETLSRLHQADIRAALFMDADVAEIQHLKDMGYDRIELYTEWYARQYNTEHKDAVLQVYRDSISAAKALGLGVNAGHDLDLNNLAAFVAMGDILEVSIGHALTVECLDQGMEAVVKQYLAICRAAKSA